MDVYIRNPLGTNGEILISVFVRFARCPSQERHWPDPRSGHLPIAFRKNSIHTPPELHLDLDLTAGVGSFLPLRIRGDSYCASGTLEEADKKISSDLSPWHDHQAECPNKHSGPRRVVFKHYGVRPLRYTDATPYTCQY